MTRHIEKGLLQAIRNDDVKGYDALILETKRFDFRLGRFPLLSLMYLYGANRLIGAHEDRLIKLSAYAPLPEPAGITASFSAKAGKCLRLYLNETVSPLEMLLILDKTRYLKRVFPYAPSTAEIRARLQSIYYIKYSLSLWFDGDGVFMDKRPLRYSEKRNIALACAFSALAVTAAVVVPVTVTSVNHPADGQVSRLSQIDFSSTNEYTLKKNITLPSGFFAETVNCKIDGNGKKLVFGKGAAFGELHGTLENMTVESEGNAIIDVVGVDGEVKSVTLSVDADAADGRSFFVNENYGVIDGVTATVRGALSATAGDSSGELICGGIAGVNSYFIDERSQTVITSVISDCAVNYELELSGSVTANAQFGGIAGVNYGYVEDCAVDGDIKADTFDIGGICAVNNGVLSRDANGASLSQTSASDEWNPIASGVVITNTYIVDGCKNTGDVSSVSNTAYFDKNDEYEQAASAAGIAYISRGTTATAYLSDCENSGKITSRAAYMDAYAAGISVSSSGGTERCASSGGVSARADGGRDAYAGGICARAYGYVYKSVNSGAISATAGGCAYAGGVSAHSRSQFLYCMAECNVSAVGKTARSGGIFGLGETDRYGNRATAESCIADCSISVDAESGAYVGGIAGYITEAGIVGGGGVTNSVFAGEIGSVAGYVGAIVGVVDANAYATDSYTSGGVEYKCFDGNYYAAGSVTAFGATLYGSTYSAVPDKGATATDGDIKTTAAYLNILSELEKSD